MGLWSVLETLGRHVIPEIRNVGRVVLSNIDGFFCPFSMNDHSYSVDAFTD